MGIELWHTARVILQPACFTRTSLMGRLRTLAHLNIQNGQYWRGDMLTPMSIPNAESGSARRRSRVSAMWSHLTAECAPVTRQS